MNFLAHVQGQFLPEKGARQAKVAEREGKSVMILGDDGMGQMRPRAEPAVFVRSHDPRSCALISMLRPAYSQVNAPSEYSMGQTFLPAGRRRRPILCGSWDSGGRGDPPVRGTCCCSPRRRGGAGGGC